MLQHPKDNNEKPIYAPARLIRHLFIGRVIPINLLQHSKVQILKIERQHALID